MRCLGTKATTKVTNETADFFELHLLHMQNNYVSVLDLMRHYVQASGNVKIPYKTFLSLVRKAKAPFLLKYDKEYLFIDHACTPAPPHPVHASLGRLEIFDGFEPRTASMI
jgi:hypothetical protein